MQCCNARDRFIWLVLSTLLTLIIIVGTKRINSIAVCDRNIFTVDEFIVTVQYLRE